MLKVIILTILTAGLIFGAYVGYQRINNQVVEDIPASREGGLVEPFEKPEVVSKEFIKVIFKEGTDITEFAKKYNIDAAKIEGPSLAEVYRIPVPEGENIVSIIELFRKDPDVVSAKFEVYAVPQ